jgi:energy-coupling factor transporter ATP-binding protein EcfA2
MFVGALVSTRRAAVVTGYIVSLFGGLMAILLADGIYGNFPFFSLGSKLPSSLLVFPVMGLARGVYLLNWACIAQLQCYGPLGELPPGDELGPVIGSLYACAVVYMAAGLWLEAVFPGPHGVPRHPLFCCHPRAAAVLTAIPRCCSGGGARLAGGRRSSSSSSSSSAARGDGGASGLGAPLLGDAAAAAVGGGSGGGTFTTGLPLGRVGPRAAAAAAAGPADGVGVSAGDAGAVAAGEDGDVVAERARVCAMRIEDVVGRGGDAGVSVPIFWRHVRKVYDGAAAPAVDDVSLAVPAGENLGLLGENGAGKTTLIGISTALFPATSGEARVGGYDAGTQAEGLHRVIGVCPQHDRLWDTLTPAEHLTFYARLKGVPAESEAAHVAAALAEVGLCGAPAHRAAGELSGGMRRRLSVAVAFVGGATVAFLDEPTTGARTGSCVRE